MNSKLSRYFPNIWERNELIQAINDNKTLASRFSSWTPEQQQEFLDFCTVPSRCLIPDFR